MVKSNIDNGIENEDEEEEGTDCNIESEDDDTGEDTNKENTIIPSLYNPFTTTHIPLPSLPPNICGKGQVWCDPTKASPGQPLVSMLHGLFRMSLLIYLQGDDNWSEIETPSGVQIASTVYHEAEAMLYVVYWDGRLSVLDLATRTLRPLMDTPYPEIESLNSCGCLLLVVGAAGDLLLVASSDMYLISEEHSKEHHIFKLDRRCFKWVRTTNIGEDTLFQKDNNLLSVACDPAFTDAQPNQIYFFNQYKKAFPVGQENKIEMLADIEVWDLVAAGSRNNNDDLKEQLSFETSNILEAKPPNNWYQQFGAWMVPSHK